MTIETQRWAVLERKSKKNPFERYQIQGKPEQLNIEWNNKEIDILETWTTPEIRAYLRDEKKLPIKDEDGHLYAYRIYDTAQKLKTLFPNTKAGEKPGVHGTLPKSKPQYVDKKEKW